MSFGWFAMWDMVIGIVIFIAGAIGEVLHANLKYGGKRASEAINAITNDSDAVPVSELIKFGLTIASIILWVFTLPYVFSTMHQEIAEYCKSRP